MTYRNHTITYGGDGYYHFWMSDDPEDSNHRGVGKSVESCMRQIDDCNEQMALEHVELDINSFDKTEGDI